MRHLFARLLVIAAVGAMAGVATAQDADWNGYWSGLWEGKAATLVTILDGRVTDYTYLGRTQRVTDVTFAGDTVSFNSNEETGVVTLRRIMPNKAQAEYVNVGSKGTATLTKL